MNTHTIFASIISIIDIVGTIILNTTTIIVNIIVMNTTMANLIIIVLFRAWRVISVASPTIIVVVVDAATAAADNCLDFCEKEEMRGSSSEVRVADSCVK